MVRRTDFDSVEGLLELAVDAEQTVENAKTFRPPPLPAAALLPEMAYKPSPNTETPRKPKVELKDSKVSAIEEKHAKNEDLEQMLRRVLKQLLPDRGSSEADRSGKSTADGPRRGRGYQPTGRNGTRKSPEPKSERGKGATEHSTPNPNSGSDTPKGPRPPPICYSCGLPGYIARNCPNCSGNAKGGA